MSKDHLSDRDLLPEAAHLSVLAVEKSNRGWIVRAEGASFAVCPLCGNRSRARHSRYWRQFKDLPVQGTPVILKIRLGRWHCRNSTCERKIFTERIPEAAAPYSQRTKRMDEIVRLVGHGLGGRPAEKLMKRLGMGVSDDTILRRLKKGRTASHVPEPPRVLGVDEWAWKKGQQHYGTILVDLERHVVADLMAERSSSRLAEWLRKRPSVEIVSRDRYGLYAQGAQQGAPQARQIADRFHLLMNLREAVQCELSRRRRFLLLTPPPDPTVPRAQDSPTGGAAKSWRNPEVAAHNQDIVMVRRAEKQALFETVHALHLSGNCVTAITRDIGIGRKRVDRWIRLRELPERNKMEPKPDSPAFFREHLARRWTEGCQHARTLLSEIRKLGYTGCYSGLARFISQWRDVNAELTPIADKSTCFARTSAEVSAQRVSPLVAAALLFKPRPHLTARQAEKVDALKQVCPDFALMRSLVMSFRGILRSTKPHTLDSWMERAVASGIHSMKQFAKNLHRDLEAVKNAIREPFSNGPVEGHINRLKALKRAMYGRAGFELLRLRILPLNDGRSDLAHQT